LSERTTACWICLSETPPDTPDGRYHHACLEAVFGVTNAPAIEFDQLAVTTWAEEHEGRMSISGYQPKGPAALDESRTRLLLVEKDSTHIVKPPHPQYLHINENEHLTMRLARMVGLAVAEHGLIELSDGAIAYVTKRFDRADGSKGSRLHVMDFCQLAEKDPADKEESTAEECAHIARTYGNESTPVALFKLLVFSDWVRNGDLHLKNMMLMETAGAYALAPGYDLLCTEVYGTKGQKLPVEGERINITRKMWISFAEKNCAMDRAQAERIIDAMLARLPEAKALIDRSAFPKVEWKTKYKHFLEKKTRHLAGSV
jgi:serine/threonine-protein kinase HipA